VTVTEVFPTGVVRVIYSPTEAPTKVGYDEVKDQVPGGSSGLSRGRIDTVAPHPSVGDRVIV
jgi:hypothetical protein